MKKSLILLGMSLLAACGVQKTELPLLPEEAFQTTVDGKPVALYTLHAGDITGRVYSAPSSVKCPFAMRLA